MRNGKSRLFERVVTAVWFLVSLPLAYNFLRNHPPRPLFSAPVRSAAARIPWADHAGAIAGMAFVAALLFASGCGMARLLKTDRPTILSTIGLGAIFASTVTFLLLSLGIFRPIPLGLLLLLPLLFVRGTILPRPVFNTTGFSPAGILAAVLSGAAILGVLVHTLAPLTANDPIVYHMTIASSYAGGGEFGAAPDLVYSHMPHSAELLYACTFLFGGEGSARLFHLLLFVLNIAVVARLARRFRPEGGAAGVVILFATLPLVLDCRTVGNVDLVLSLFFALSLLHILDYRSAGKTGDLLAAALFAGGMLTVKFSAYAAYPIPVAALLIPLAGMKKRPGPRPLLLFLLISHILLLPWMVKAWMQTGNPIFPLFPSLLGGTGWNGALAARLIEWQRAIGMGRDPLASILLPWNAVFHGQPTYRFFDGILSPALILWAPWAIVRGGSGARRFLLIALAGVCIWGFGSQQLRFLLPVVILAVAIIGAFWSTEKNFRGVLQGLFFVGLAGALLTPFLLETSRDTLPVVLGLEERETYLQRKVQSYEAFRALSEYVPPGEKVLLVWENRVYHFPRPFLADSFFEASRVAGLAAESGSPERFLARVKDEGCRWALVNRPLQNVFARRYPPPVIGILDAAWGECDLIDNWKGLELYRLP